MAKADCLANSELNDFFEYADRNKHQIDDDTATEEDAAQEKDDRRQSIPRFGSCCMYDVCGLACPTPHVQPNDGTYTLCTVCVCVCVCVLFVRSCILVMFASGFLKRQGTHP